MLKTPQTIVVNWCCSNKKYYESKGYSFTNYGEKLKVAIEDLIKGSKKEIEIICDFCGEEFKRVYATYNATQKKSFSDKDSCNNCSRLKQEHTHFLKYGNKSISQLPFVLEKRKSTSIKKYGHEHHMKSPKFLKSFFDANLETLGVRFPAESKEIMNKVAETNLKKYGVSTPLMLEENRNKTSIALSKSKRIKTSKQQEYIYSLIGGEYNFPVGRYLLDIAFPESKIFIEYDGSGHNLSVKLGKITQEEFDIKEKERFNFLYDNGWREVRIVSLNDKLPLKEEFLSMLNKAFKKLEKESSLMKIKIFIDKKDVELHRVKGEKRIG